jgi:hypothetical protein
MDRSRMKNTCAFAFQLMHLCAVSHALPIRPGAPVAYHCPECTFARIFIEEGKPDGRRLSGSSLSWQSRLLLQSQQVC